VVGRSISGSWPRVASSALVVALAVIFSVNGITLAARQETTSATRSAATVPAAPPWRAELVPRNRPLTVTVGDTAVLVEVANNDTERQLGLGQRAGLLPDTGMLFVFDGPPENRNFWMGGMRFCLDIIWLRNDEIVGAAESTCPGPPGEGQAAIPRHQSPGAAEYVLEMPAGFLAENGYGVGTPVTFSADPYGVPTPEPAGT
jgi:uncharacterized membrane protein (UPF0127 family)